jgi:hypothetical protein
MLLSTNPPQESQAVAYKSKRLVELSIAVSMAVVLAFVARDSGNSNSYQCQELTLHRISAKMVVIQCQAWVVAPHW